MSNQTHQIYCSCKQKVEPNPTNFGARLRALIEGKGLTLAQFLTHYDISESQLHNWLKRNAPPLEKHWAPLAEFFGVSTNYLAYGTPEKQEYAQSETSAGVGGVQDDPPRAEDHIVDLSPRERAGVMRAQIRTICEDSIAQAGDELPRLGWLLEQARAHLRAPAHWHVPGQEAPRQESAAIREAKRIGEEGAFRDAAEILERERQAHGNPPTAKSG